MVLHFQQIIITEIRAISCLQGGIARTDVLAKRMHIVYKLLNVAASIHP